MAVNQSIPSVFPLTSFLDYNVVTTIYLPVQPDFALPYDFLDLHSRFRGHRTSAQYSIKEQPIRIDHTLCNCWTNLKIFTIYYVLFFSLDVAFLFKFLIKKNKLIIRFIYYFEWFICILWKNYSYFLIENFFFFKQIV